MNKVFRGDIYYIEHYLTEGSEQRAGRPAVIVSNDMNNNYSPTVEVVYLTTQPKSDLPTHVTIRSTNRESIALCEQITSISKDRIGDFVCTASPDELERINTALLVSLSLEPAPVKKAEAKIAVPAPAKAETDAAVTAERDVYKKLYEDLLARVLVKA